MDLSPIVIALVALAVTVLGNIFLMARWSGQVDEKLQTILGQPTRWTSDLNSTAATIRAELDAKTTANAARLTTIGEEVMSLRKSRHDLDATVQRHDGALTVQGHVLNRLLSALHLEHQDGLDR